MVTLLFLTLSSFANMFHTTETPFVHNLASTSIGSTTWVEVKQNISKRINSIDITNTSGEAFYLGYSADSSSPTGALIVIPAAGLDNYPLSMPANSDIFLKSVDAAAAVSSGKIYFNMGFSQSTGQ